MRMRRLFPVLAFLSLWSDNGKPSFLVLAFITSSFPCYGLCSVTSNSQATTACAERRSHNLDPLSRIALVRNRLYPSQDRRCENDRTQLWTSSLDNGAAEGENGDASNQSADDVDVAAKDTNASFLRAQGWKRELIQLAASYDRGFGASPTARNRVSAVIGNLEQEYDPTLSTAADDMLFSTATIAATASLDNASLIGNWRMVWTTALDVLSLSASPFFTPGAIYQVFDGSGNRRVTNIIDIIPRAQALFPLPGSLGGLINTPTSLIRAKVQTRACLPRASTSFTGSNSPFSNKRDASDSGPTLDTSSAYPNRVGLIFESVSVQPIQLLGFDSSLLPPLAFDLPKLPGADDTTSPGYFDVTYLDAELLIIRQNALDGLFCLLRVDSIDA